LDPNIPDYSAEKSQKGRVYRLSPDSLVVDLQVVKSKEVKTLKKTNNKA
jgi:hypothetical protein